MNNLSILGIFVADLSFFGKIPTKGETVLGDDFVVGPGGKGSNQSVAAGKAGAGAAKAGGAAAKAGGAAAKQASVAGTTAGSSSKTAGFGQKLGDAAKEGAKDAAVDHVRDKVRKAAGPKEEDTNEETLHEISADTALAASKEADKKRGKLAAAGDKEGAKKKNAQAVRLYKASAAKRKTETKEEYTVTNADKKGNTPAYQGYKAGKKNVKTGKPMYKAADHMKEEQLQEKQKDTPDQVAAVIDMYRSKKGTDAATYDSMHGKKKEAKKERDYAKFERDKMARDAQKAGHPWEHAKGSTTEKEGKKSVKHAHVKDSYDWQTESDLWDDIAEKLSELHELGGVKFKVVPFDLQEEENWIQGAVKRPGAFTKKAKAAGMSVQQFAKHVDANKDKYSTRTERQANLAQTFSKMKKEGADYDALSSFLVQEGADDQSVNYILANWVEDETVKK